MKNSFVGGAAWLLLSLTLATAFPPAPYYTIHGIVRDQVGQSVTADGAVVILLKDGVEVGRAPIVANRIDQSYELNLRLDQNRSGTTFYSERAFAAGGLFSLVVMMNGHLFYPIEVAGNLSAGKGGERVKLDLTLGEDLDKDGLPDAWEAWQLYQAGLYPGDDGYWDLSLIDKSGDFDRDGQSNFLEYIAGTFAGDSTETFSLTIKEKLRNSIRFEFFGITGKVYTLESTHDLKTWTRIPFAVEPDGAANTAHQAAGVGFVSASASTDNRPTEFYRLTVR